MTKMAAVAFHRTLLLIALGAAGCGGGGAGAGDAAVAADGAPSDDSVSGSGGSGGNSGGSATAIEIANTPVSNGVIEANGTHVYFETRGNVSRVLLAGGTVERASEGNGGVASIGLDDTALFVLDNGGLVPSNGAIKRIAFASIPGDDAAVIEHQSDVSNFITAGDDLVWISSTLAATTIKTMPKTGTVPVAVADLGNQAWFAGLASVGANIVYGHRIALSSGVSSAPRAGGGVAAVLVMGQEPRILSFTADASGVYFTTGTGGNSNAKDGKLWKAPLTGGSATMLASDINEPGRVLADGSNVYWMDAGLYDGTYKQGTINRVAKSGGATKLVVSSADPFPSKYAFAISGGSLFFLVDASVGGMPPIVRLMKIDK